MSKTNTPENPAQASTKPKQENGFLNIAFNVLLPVLILNKGHKYASPEVTLLVALAFPLGWGIFDLIKKRKWNPFSILGAVNVLVTGSLAIIGLDGIWFAIKEAFFPFAIGVAVWFSARTKKPFIRTLLFNPQVMRTELIEGKLQERNSIDSFEAHLRTCTQWLAISFFFSATLNFFLAQKIFTPLPMDLDATARSEMLNQQIAQMTTWSMAVIMVPSILFLVGILNHLMKGIKRETGLSMEEFLH